MAYNPIIDATHSPWSSGGSDTLWNWIANKFIYGSNYPAPPVTTSIQNLSPGDTPAVPVNGEMAQQSINSIISQNVQSIQSGEQSFFSGVADNLASMDSSSWLKALVVGVGIIAVINALGSGSPSRYGR